MTESGFEFSVLISSVDRWPHVKQTLDSVLDQLPGYQVEIILVSSIPDVYPHETNSGIKVLICLGADMFRLRLEGIRACSGQWIILLEDHNEVPPALFDTLHAAIGSDILLKAIVTSLVNGSEKTTIDQANFLFNFSAYLPEFFNLNLERHPVIAGACFRRSLVSNYTTLKEGELELKLLPQCYRNGNTVFVKTISISHIQSNALFPTLLKHFHNAKACAGLLKKMNDDRLHWPSFKASIKAPLFFYRKWTSTPYRLILIGRYQRCQPYLILIGIIYGIGGVMGWVFGKGRSGHLLG